MKFVIREIEPKDDRQIESVIRSCLIEFGADHEGTAWADPELCRLSNAYAEEGAAYWVVENDKGEIIGGAGIGKLTGNDKVCELQKMYCLPEARGTGAAQLLMEKALDFAKKYYSKCYLETLDNMTRAHRFYEQSGFVRIYEPIVKTDHFACDVLYIKALD